MAGKWEAQGACIGPEGSTLGVERDTLDRAARSDCTLLLTGETGVGKGHLAQWLHGRGPRSSGPFIPVNCGAIPESLIDSQLFGHVRGAFSGASSDHPGFVRAATGGTLFLDEVGELPPDAQIRLLRLLTEREIQPVGQPTPTIVDVRVMAATNGDLDAAVADGRFREDLLYRLDVVRLHVAPLRRRPRDLEVLREAFKLEFAAEYGRPALDFTDSALGVLRTETWPGNVRQLRTVIERLYVLCPDDEVTDVHLARYGRLEPRETPPDQRLDRLRLAEVHRVLAEAGGSISRAADAFGVHRSTIYRWLNRSADEDEA